MIDKSIILKFVKHVHKRGQGVTDRRLIYPQRDWIIGLGVFMVVVGVGTVFSVHLFSTYKNIDQQTYEVDKELPVYQASIVTSVLETFSKRQLYFDALVAGIQPRIEVQEEVASSTATTTNDRLNQDGDGNGVPLSPDIGAPPARN